MIKDTFEIRVWGSVLGEKITNHSINSRLIRIGIRPALFVGITMFLINYVAN